EIHGVPLTYFQERNEKLLQIEPQTLQTIAQKYLLPEAMTIAVCGDGPTLQQQLQIFGKVEMF
ncbi:MAG TPA: hypothetical protein PLQ21_00870, partial [Candidatus Kapabacteria bacterium]|nr:hypothetical protein [Candidatus Kapabacteria bacterium]